MFYLNASCIAAWCQAAHCFFKFKLAASSPLGQFLILFDKSLIVGSHAFC